MKNEKITTKQKRVLNLIYNNLKNNGFPPTLAELRGKLKVASNQAVLNFLDSLERKNYIKRGEGQARGIKITKKGFQILGKNALVPMVGESSAGAYVKSFTDVFTDWIKLPGQILENEEVNLNEDVFLIKVNGDSMINAGIDDGDILLVQKTQEFKSGDIVVARSDEGTTVKRFIAEDGRIYLKPENPKYDNILILEDTYFDGKVVLNLSKIIKSKK